MTLDRAAGLAESARALADGEVSSRALVEQALARIVASQPSVNAFRVVRAEAALAGGLLAVRVGCRGRVGRHGQGPPIRLRLRFESLWWCS